MNQLQKAKEYADRYNGNYQISQDDIEEAYIVGSKSGYFAGVSDAWQIKSEDDRITELVTKLYRIQTVFEEMLAQHIVLKELRDFYRNRAGINTEEE